MNFWDRLHHQRTSVVLETETEFVEICAVRSEILCVLQNRLVGISGIEYTYDHRHHLIAQFLQGVHLSYEALSQGLYGQAANLQKQQIETLAAIKECEKDRRKEGKTPNVQNAIPALHQEYINLNDVAHPSREDIVYSLTSYNSGNKRLVSAFPQFKPDICRAMLINHCHYLFGLFIGLQNLLEENPPPQLSDEEKAMFVLWRKLKDMKASQT